MIKLYHKKGLLNTKGYEQEYNNKLIYVVKAYKATRKLFDEDFYNSLDKSKYVIDMAAQDNLYNKNKLIRIVNEESLGGYGFEAEFSSSKYTDIKGNVVKTPHIGFGTIESYDRWYRGWVKTIISCYNGNPINVVKT